MSKPTERSINRPTRDISGGYPVEAVANDNSKPITLEAIVKEVLHSGVAEIAAYDGYPVIQRSIAEQMAGEYAEQFPDMVDPS